MCDFKFQCSMCNTEHGWNDCHDCFCGQDNTVETPAPNGMGTFTSLICHHCKAVAAIYWFDENQGGGLFISAPPP